MMWVRALEPQIHRAIDQIWDDESEGQIRRLLHHTVNVFMAGLANAVTEDRAKDAKINAARNAIIANIEKFSADELATLEQVGLFNQGEVKQWLEIRAQVAKAKKKNARRRKRA